MTPKEKAKDLVSMFYYIDSDSEIKDNFKMPIFYAQRCALKVIDEVINEIYECGEVWMKKRIDYWEEVKEEI